jgi:hypothetical protein
MTKKGGIIQGEKRVGVFLRLSRSLECCFRKVLEKSFWCVSSMKHFLTMSCLLCNDSVAENADPYTLILEFHAKKIKERTM